ncbi:hypothetical protein EB796_013185 [Bugula neritina]|uniref:Uncharacterized protein n=1 Tax=Bugula neritina TaxID=10212 RepID=A0A7J7JQ56_BUGNE|nr:hypothetical protein EB796_013185 [Bugula neritina]
MRSHICILFRVDNQSCVLVLLRSFGKDPECTLTHKNACRDGGFRNNLESIRNPLLFLNKVLIYTCRRKANLSFELLTLFGFSTTTFPRLHKVVICKE